MLTYLLLEENDKEVIYKYHPEGGNTSGLITVSKATGECVINKLSPNDRHQRYALKMFKRLREFVSNGLYEKEGIVAWS